MYIFINLAYAGVFQRGTTPFLWKPHVQVLLFTASRGIL